VLQVLQYFIPVAVLLVAKLIAGESQDNKLEIIPASRASQRGDVLDEDGFSLEHVHLQLGSRKTGTS